MLDVTPSCSAVALARMLDVTPLCSVVAGRGVGGWVVRACIALAHMLDVMLFHVYVSVDVSVNSNVHVYVFAHVPANVVFSCLCIFVYIYIYSHLRMYPRRTVNEKRCKWSGLVFNSKLPDDADWS